MSKKWIAVLVITLITGLIGFNVWKSQAKTTLKVETVTLSEEVMKETVMTPGNLTLSEEQLVMLEAEKGKLAEVLVKEGETVKKGDPLVRYEDTNLALEKQQNELQIKSVYLELENLRKKHTRIDKQIEEAKNNDVLEDEPNQNDMLQDEHDQIVLQQQTTNLELERANLEKEALTKREQALIVTAELDGTVLEVNEKVNASVQMGESALVRIGSLDDVVVSGTISEYDSLNIEKGQAVKLSSDAIPDKEWKGKVTSVANLPEEVSPIGKEGGATSVMYAITVTPEEKISLKLGFKMIIEIATSEAKVSTLPASAVQQKDDETFVYIVKDGKAKRTNVKIGSVTSEMMEIKEGLTNDDQVIVNPSDGLEAGTEVTVK